MKYYIEKCLRREDLTVEEASEAMQTIMDGAATEAQVAGMIQRIFRIDSEIEPNAADALAVAVCHINTYSSNMRWNLSASKDSTSKNSTLKNPDRL